MPSSPPRKLYSLRALGHEDPPLTLSANNLTYTRTHLIKHDFFAATAFYVDPAGNKAVYKVGRIIPWCGIPLQWLGRRLRDRETRIYEKLHDLPNIPRMIARIGPTGFLHAFVEGRPLEKGKPVPDNFFPDLFALIAEVHRRGIAYVDTNKPQNILLGDDNRPHLIDFQISWDHGPGFLLRRLQREDLYHLRKHHRRLRPDQLTPAQLAEYQKVGFWVRLHRTLTWPYFKLRRALFSKLQKSGRLLDSGSD